MNYDLVNRSLKEIEKKKKTIGEYRILVQLKN
jgi:hypothetical protein